MSAQVKPNYGDRRPLNVERSLLNGVDGAKAGTAGRVSLKPFLLMKKPIPTIGTPFLTTYTFINPRHWL